MRLLQGDLNGQDPRAKAELVRALAREEELDGVVPDIFHWKQRLMFHLGNKPSHPANRRVTLTVALADLRARYGLSDTAAQFLVQVRAPRAAGRVSLSMCALHVVACVRSRAPVSSATLPLIDRVCSEARRCAAGGGLAVPGAHGRAQDLVRPAPRA